MSYKDTNFVREKTPNKVDRTIKQVKCGSKSRHVTIPEGWVKVTSGEVFRGDQFFDLYRYRFMPVEDDDRDGAMFAEDFDCLIRRIELVPKFCEESEDEFKIRAEAHRDVM